MSGLLGILSSFGFIVVLLVLSLAGAAIKVVQEYERGVIFRLGRLVGARGPGSSSSSPSLTGWSRSTCAP